MSITLYPSPATSLCALSVVRDLLRFADAYIEDDAVLQTFIDAADAEFVQSCGQPIRATIDTYIHRARASALTGILKWRPCASLTAVERYDGANLWTALTLSQCRLHDMRSHYTLEYDGVLCRDAMYRLSMTVGYTVIPKDIQCAIANHAILAYKDSPLSGDKGDRLGLGQKVIEGEGGATGYTITFDKSDFRRQWNRTVESYRILPSL